MALFVRTQDKDQTKNRIAGFFGLSGGAKTRAGRSRTQRNRQFLGIEEMEGRTMMSNIPVFTSVQVPAYGSTVLPLAPMENSVAKGTFLPGQTSTGGVHANLTAGVLYTVSDDVQSSPQYTGYPATTAPSLLQVIEPSGSYVTFHSTYPGSTVNPETGLQTNDNTVIFRAPTTGLYTFVVGTKYTGASYSVSVRPITMDNSGLAPMQNASDAAKLSFQGGGLYAYLDPTNTVLTLAGPTGRGFQIGGQFTETTRPIANNWLASTITATGTLTLESALGNIPLPLAPGAQLVVSTAPNGYNGLFGQVSSTDIQFPYKSLVSTLVSPFGSTLGNYVSVANQALSYLGLKQA